MNHANEAALTQAIAQVLASPEGWRAMDEPAAMARELIATCGALVPSALTGSDTKTAVHAGLDYDVGLAGGRLPAVKGEKFVATGPMRAGRSSVRTTRIVADREPA